MNDASEDPTLGGAEGEPSAEDTLAPDVTAPRSADVSKLSTGQHVGRYVVLGKLGVGGMGVVYAAYDPELDRKIALKLLRVDARGTSAQEGRTRLLREAQAMARLSHPNVVAVHDVGTIDEQVFVAMEFVDGRTLRGWLDERERSWREVLDVLLRAGRGVAAAHAVDLVHRDLKPDNVMVAGDGRVRVMDFGLARPVRVPEVESQPPLASASGALDVEVTRAGALLGTPAYMAPEQHRGESTDARTDQFSFCVMAWEALYGERPFAGETHAALMFQVLQGNVRPPPRSSKVPAWVRRALEVGLALEPTKRWSGMDALLAALEADPARRRVGFGALGVLALVVVVGVGVNRFQQARTLTECEQAGAEIEELWASSREAVERGLTASGAAFADETWIHAQPWLDRFATDWRETRTQACVQARVDRSSKPQDYDAVVECLDRRRARFELLLGLFAEADSQVAQRAVLAAAGLGDPQQCTEGSLHETDGRADEADELWLELERVRTLELAGRHAEALAIASKVAEAAEAAEVQSVLAEAWLRSGVLAGGVDDFERAELELARAFFLAGSVGADAVAAEAAIAQVDVVGTILSRHAEGELWADLADMHLRRLGEDDGFRAARAANARAGLLYAQGKYDEAKPLYERALAMQEKLLGADHPELVQALGSLGRIAHVRREFEVAERLHRHALALSEATLGTNHDKVAACLVNLGAAVDASGRPDEAQPLYERAIAIVERTVGPEDHILAAPLGNLASIHEGREDYDKALPLRRRAFETTEKVFGRDHPQMVDQLNSLAGLLHLMGRLDEARSMYERAIAIVEIAHGPENPDVIRPLYNLALVHEAAGDYATALPLYQRSAALTEKIHGPNHPEVGMRLLAVADALRALGNAEEALPLAERAVVLLEKDEWAARELAWARWILAKVLVALDRDEARARELAIAARDRFRIDGESEAASMAEQMLER